MLVGVVTERKQDEYRVAMTPSGVHELVRDGHEVLVEAGAGEGSQFTDQDYVGAGARIADRDAVWDTADMVMKVKEPLAEEVALLRPGQVLFTYLHLAPVPDLARALCDTGATCIAYETVSTEDGRTPLLAPMSEVAGRLAPQVGAGLLERPRGGRGVLLGGVPGVRPAKVVVLGGGMAGSNAAGIALALGANTTVVDLSVDRMRELERTFSGRLNVIMSSRMTIIDLISDADLVIGAVLVPGAKAPSLVDREMLRSMRPRSVVVDIAVDQGGCFETTRPTTHSDPTYEVEDVIHYCVANMPGAVPVTSTHALTNVTLPFIRRIAASGVERALLDDPMLARGANVIGSHVTNVAVADAIGADAVPVHEALALTS